MQIHLWQRQTNGRFYWLDEDHYDPDAKGPGHNGLNIAAGPFLDVLDATIDANEIAGKPVDIISTSEPTGVDYAEE